VFPVSVAAEKSGTFLNWEGRERRSERALRSPLMTDARVLAALAAELDVTGFPQDHAQLKAQLDEFGGWQGARVEGPQQSPLTDRETSDWSLATWRPLLENKVMQEGEPYLAGTAHPQEVWLSAAGAQSLGAAEGDLITVSAPSAGSVTAPLVVTEVADGTVVVTGDAHRTLAHGNAAGGPVSVTVGGQR